MTGADRVSVGNLLPQPQVADHSYLVDTDNDVFPYGWLMHGSDGPAATWQLQYASSTSDAATWGEATDVSPIPLGAAQTFTPLDTAGEDTAFARYYRFSSSIDSSPSSAFPQTATQTPSIDSTSLFLTTDPNRRMRFGKAFIDGQLRPFDTPFSDP